jgi:redox-sensitive bicupin YhaK (pirin superfamily)
MSNLEQDPVETACGGVATLDADGPGHELLAPREVPLGGPRAMLVRRTLPHRERRMVGAWCFVDHYGPDDLTGADGMQVPPHPHTGLQTVSWLLDGEVLHLDSLGNRQLIRPGQLNLMTAGHGIAHAEESLPAPQRTTNRLHGVQLWVALPAASRGVAPAFEHHATLPVLRLGGVELTVLVGGLDGAASAATTFSPLLGADARLAPGSAAALPLDPAFEHAVLVTDGAATVDGHPVPRGALLVLDRGRTSCRLASEPGAQLLLLGGTPFEERIVMWWNFVGADHDEVAAARADWAAAAERFGPVPGARDGRLPAPTLPTTRLVSRGRHRSDRDR